MQNANELTAERARELLHYDPETGLFKWKSPSWRHSKLWFSGKKHSDGYFVVEISKIQFLAHRMAWLIQKGRWPEDQIDHVNGIRTDNRFSNLREVAHGENQRNMKRSKANTSGITGVCFDKQNNKWIAAIWINGKAVKLGRFKTIEEAAAIRKQASEVHGYHENHGR